MITLEFYCDPTRPWCYIGKRRLESALGRLGGRFEDDVRWRPFETGPISPPMAFDPLVVEAARAEGLTLRPARTRSPFDAHRLMVLAGRRRLQDVVVESLMRACLTDGRDLADRATLLEIAESAGLERATVGPYLESDDGSDEVRASSAKGRRLGVTGVPHIRINDSHQFAYTWDADSLASAIARAGTPGGLVAIGPSGRAQYGFERTRCGCDFCRVYCRHIPGRLDPSDVARLCPPGEDVFAWAERHLRAITDRPYPKLVPARQENGHCHWHVGGLCSVHGQAPYGCAYYDAHMTPDEADRRSAPSVQSAKEDAAADGLHARVWRHLVARGLTRPSGDRSPVEAEARRLLLSMGRA